MAKLCPLRNLQIISPFLHSKSPIRYSFNNTVICCINSSAENGFSARASSLCFCTASFINFLLFSYKTNFLHKLHRTFCSKSSVFLWYNKHNIVMSKFPERLKEARKEWGLSQTELAKRCGTCLRNVSYWESGQRECDFDTLLRIACELEVSTDYLLGKSDFQK